MKWLYLALSAVFLIGFVVFIDSESYGLAELSLIEAWIWIILFNRGVKRAIAGYEQK